MNWRVKHYSILMFLHGFGAAIVSILTTSVLSLKFPFFSSIMIDVIIVGVYILGMLGHYKRAGFLSHAEDRKLIQDLKHAIWAIKQLKIPAVDQKLLEQLLIDARRTLIKNEDTLRALKQMTTEETMKSSIDDESLPCEMRLESQIREVRELQARLKDALYQSSEYRESNCEKWIQKLESIAKSLNAMKRSRQLERAGKSPNNNVLLQNFTLISTLRGRVAHQRALVEYMKNLTENLHLQLIHQEESQTSEIDNLVRQLHDQHELLLTTGQEIKQISA